MRKLKLASINILGITLNFTTAKIRYQAIADYFNKSDIDVIFFQEVFSYFHLRILKDNIKEYPFCIYKPMFFGPKGGLVIFSKYKISNIFFVEYSLNKMPLVSIPEKIFQKGILGGVIDDLDITLANTHLTAVINHDYSKSSKYFQNKIGEISEFHNTLKSIGENKLVIVGGDFNIKKGSDMYKQLINFKDLDNVFKEGKPTRHREFVSKGSEPNCIDYLFIVSDGVKHKITAKEYIFSEKSRLSNRKFGYISDHIGLSVNVQVA